ncbi:MAG: carboxylesterase family protein [Planctomycetota bacterium]
MTTSTTSRLVLMVALATALAAVPVALAREVESIVPTEAIAIGRLGQAGRSPVYTDALMATIVDGTFTLPSVGDTIELPSGETQTWKRLEADENGWFGHRGWAVITVTLDEAAVMSLHARGHSAVYVNGRPRYGDPYNTGYVRLPVDLRRGENVFLFSIGRGRLRMSLDPIATPVGFDPGDRTTPNLIVGEPARAECGVVIYNATNEPTRNLAVRASNSVLGETVTPIPSVPPMSVRKVPLTVNGPAPRMQQDYQVRLELIDRDRRQAVLGESSLRLGAVMSSDLHTRTFRSALDDSVQYYAVRPAAADGETTAPPGIVLSLHGASVEGRGQAACYRARPWCHVVSPTNRRPYGFDWEDWGRLDALEVLAEARTRYRNDDRQAWVTGHSMGGHGAWHMGLTYPDLFAAVAPSAGWVSFWSYTGAAEPSGGAVESILQRATSPSRTLGLLPNTRTQGIYILHGDADDNVPVEQARTMRRELGAFHPDFTYYEQRGAGHWWGNQCVDWQPLMDFISRHALPAVADVRSVSFVTADPGVSSDMHWARVQQQFDARALSTIDIAFDPKARRFSGTTTNVAMLGLDAVTIAKGQQSLVEAPVFPRKQSVTIELDGQSIADIPWPGLGEDHVWMRRALDGTWSAGPSPNRTEKTPTRCGPFKAAFRNRMMFVYGTKGTPVENAWALDKARFDAETFWYRGNGSVDVLADVDFNARAHPDRNVVLYGNSQTNGAWDDLVAPCGVEVGGGRITIGEETMIGDDLAILMVRPRPEGSRASVAVVGGTGIRGMRVTDRLPYFVSGVAYPDITVIGSDMLSNGTSAVRAAGFFGPDWSLETGSIAFRE